MSILVLLALTACRSEHAPEDTSALSESGWDTGPEDQDGDGFTAELDCDDSDPEVNPSATEVCDGVDNDCDELIDEELLVDRYRS